MLDDCTYNKLKLIHDLSGLIWFIRKYAKKDATNAGDSRCLELLNLLEQDLEKNLEKIREGIC